MADNQVTAIPPEVIAQALDLSNQITTLLTPYMEALTPDEKHGILKMGDKTIAFVSKALSYAESAPQFAPGYMNTKDLNDDVAAVSGLTSIEQPLKNLVTQLDDTITIAGSEAYTVALMYYNSVKEGARRNMPGAKAIYDDLKVRFAKAHQKEIKPPTA